MCLRYNGDTLEKFGFNFFMRPDTIDNGVIMHGVGVTELDNICLQLLWYAIYAYHLIIGEYTCTMLDKEVN